MSICRLVHPLIALWLVSTPVHASVDGELMRVPAAQPTKTAQAKKTAPTDPAGKPQLDWRARVAVGVKSLQDADAALFDKLSNLQPDRAVNEELSFTQAEVHDPRAAPVLLRRLLQGTDPVKVRCALVEALPQTGGDWQEGAAALIGMDASPKVRRKLVEAMRYADPPHSVNGLRLGFKDDDPDINIAAARTSGFNRAGPELFTELYSSTFDADWDLRAAAVQALGMLKLPQSREVLLKALADEEREVRLQALLALEQLDPEALLEMPELDELARDRKSHRIARKANLLLQKRRAAARAAKQAAKQAARKPAKTGGGGGGATPGSVAAGP